MKSIIAGLVLLSILVPSASAEAIPQIRFSGSFQDLARIPSPKAYAFIEDKDSSLTRDDVVKKFEAGEGTILQWTGPRNFGYTTSTLWFAFEFANESNVGSNSYVEVRERRLQNLMAYVRRTQPSITTWSEEVGGTFDASPRPKAPMDAQLFNANVPPESTALILLRVRDTGPTIVDIGMFSSLQVVAKAEADSLLVTILLGAIIGLIVFNAFIFFASRDSRYAWFILHLSMLLAYVIARAYFGIRYLWSTNPTWQNSAETVFLAGVAVSAVLFLRRVFSLKTRRPVFEGFFVGHLGAYALVAGLTLMGYGWARILGCGLLLLTSILALFHILLSKMWRKETGFIVALASIALGGFLSIPITLGFDLPMPWIFVLRNAEFLGIFLEIVICSWSLIQSISRLRHEKEFAETQARIKQNFFAKISHEMRTPLNGILGFGEAIQNCDSLEDAKSYSATITAESDRLLFQINQMLDLTKIEAGYFQLHGSPFSLSDLYSYLITIYSKRIENGGVIFIADSIVPADCVVFGDRMRLEQVLRNLIENAIKFTPKGSIQIEFKRESQTATVEAWQFSVRDTGVGIEPNQVGAIFEDFYQVRGTDQGGQGAGLGLSIASRMVGIMGSSLNVRSSPGRGSRFFFTLELQRFVPKNRPLQTQSVARTKRALVVDDFEVNRRVMVLQLQGLDFVADSAESAAEAMSLIDKNEYSVVFVDIIMPEVNGIELTRRIRAIARCAGVCIVGFTASGVEDQIAVASEAGMDRLLEKPLTRTMIVEVLEELNLM